MASSLSDPPGLWSSVGAIGSSISIVAVSGSALPARRSSIRVSVVVLDAEGHLEVRLVSVEPDEEDAVTAPRERGSEVRDGGRLADPAFGGPDEEPVHQLASVRWCRAVMSASPEGVWLG